MGKIREFFDGKKSYIGMILCGVIGLATAQGWIDKETGTALLALVGSLTGVAIRAAIKKSGSNGGA